MDFNLPDTAVAVREGVLRAMSGFDHAYWSRLDEEHRFPDEAWAALADGGWLGLSCPRSSAVAGRGCSSWPSPTRRSPRRVPPRARSSTS